MRPLVALLAAVACWAYAAGALPAEIASRISSPDSLTVDQAVHLALASHPAVAQAQEAIAAAEARIASSRSPYYPDISLSAVYVRIGPVPAIDIFGGSLELAPADNYDIHFGLRQTLYDFGRTGAVVDVARSGFQTATDNLELVRANLAYRTIQVFNSILILRETVTVLDNQISDLAQHRDVSSKMVAAGTATDFDVLTTDVRIAATKNDRIDAANNLETQEILFRQLTGCAADQPVLLKGDFAAKAALFDSVALTGIAYTQRPEMAVARDAEMSAMLETRLVSLGDKPSMAVNITSGLLNGYPDNLTQLKANYSAGVQLQFPIFNGHRTRNQRREAAAGLRSAQAHTEDIKRQVAADVAQAITRARASWDKAENTEVLVRQAEEAVAMAETKYEAGVVTNLDLLDAETTLTQAKLGYLRSLYAYSTSLVDLDRATGKKVW